MRLPKFAITTIVTFLLVVILNADFGYMAQLPGARLGIDWQFLPQSQVLAQTPEELKAQADELFEQGNQQYQISQFEAALQSWQEALIIYQKINDRQGEGQSLGNLGIAYHALGDYTKAIEYHQQSLAIANKIGDRQGQLLALFNLGLGYYWLNDYAKAIDYYQQCLEILQKIPDRNHQENVLLAGVLLELGEVYYYLGDYSKSLEFHTQSLGTLREIGETSLEANALNSIANDYSELGYWIEARDYCQEALLVSRKHGHRDAEGNALACIGNYYSHQGDYQNAIDYHKQSLAIYREIGNYYNEGASLDNLGQAYLNLGDVTQAIKYHKERLAISQAIGELYGEGYSHYNLGLAFFKAGNFVEAEKSLQNGINALEQIRDKLGNNDSFKVSLFDTQANIYKDLQKVLIAQNKPDNALEISERGRARAFVELLASRLSSNPTESVNIAPPTIEQLKQTAKEQNATLVEYSIINDDFKIENKQETQESEIYIWVIKPTGEVIFRTSDLKPLWQTQKTSIFQLVGDTRESIGVKRGLGVVGRVSFANPTKKLQQLYQILIKPIADILPTQPNAHIIFIPQSSLFLVPFPALKDEEGKYLIDKFTILTAPSIQVLELTHKGATANGELGTGNPLIVGNPTMPKVVLYPGEAPEQLSPLPNAETEAKAIASLLKTQPLIGNQATETVVVEKMQQAKLIHLATHGLLDDIRGIGSAIALAPDSSPLAQGGEEGGDGLLTAEEILNLKINAQLVVLSACDTGRGKITGDGVVGLSRSLISAGVSSVIVSLWSVPDAPTAELMTEFYQNWQKQPDMAQALRQAMLTTKAKHPHPIDWAAFTLIGES